MSASDKTRRELWSTGMGRQRRGCTVPGGFRAIDWVAIPLVSGVAFTVVYLIWCAACRLGARFLRIDPSRVRIFANSTFMVAILALIVVPLFLPSRETVRVYKPAHTQTPPGQTAPFKRF